MASGILVLGSDQEELETCQRELASLGYRPIVTTDREKARALLKSERPALLFSDILWLSETAGSELLRHIRDVDSEVPVVILTGMATIDVAVAALKNGASFYLLRPFTSDHLRLAVERGIAFTTNGPPRKTTSLGRDLKNPLAKPSSARATPCRKCWTSRKKLQVRT